MHTISASFLRQLFRQVTCVVQKACLNQATLFDRQSFQSGVSSRVSQWLPHSCGLSPVTNHITVACDWNFGSVIRYKSGPGRIYFQQKPSSQICIQGQTSSFIFAHGIGLSRPCKLVILVHRIKFSLTGFIPAHTVCLIIFVHRPVWKKSSVDIESSNLSFHTFSHTTTMRIPHKEMLLE